MTHLGKALVFYLKYMAEMNRLYGHVDEGDEPDLSGVRDKERVREMIAVVGAAAFEQALVFLEECGRAIEGHFLRMKATTLSNRRRKASVREYCTVALVTRWP